MSDPNTFENVEAWKRAVLAKHPRATFREDAMRHTMRMIADVYGLDVGEFAIIHEHHGDLTQPGRGFIK
jgi:hypothetical protein